MKKMQQVCGILRSIFMLPYAIVTGRKKKVYRKIKSQLVQANLL